MAYRFDGAAAYLAGAAALTAAPVTLACWSRLTAIGTSDRVLMAIKDASEAHNRNTFRLWMQSNESLAASTGSPSGVSTSNTGAGIVAPAIWNHCAAVFASATSRIAYLNGSAAAEETTSRVPADIDATQIGMVTDTSAPSRFWDGDIAYAAIWREALLPGEILRLAAREHPEQIRRHALVAHWEFPGHAVMAMDAIGNIDLAVTAALPAGGPTLRRPRARVYSFPAPGGASTLAADSGAYTYSGTAASLLAARKLTADTGAYALTGSAVALTISRNLAADAGSYTMTGAAAGLLAQRLLQAATGAYTWSGTAADLVHGTAGGYTLAAASGTYTWSGTAASLLRAASLAGDSGTYTVTGASAGLYHGALLQADTGAYVLTGAAAALLKASVLAAGAGGYTLTGTAVTLTYSGAELILAPGLEYTAPDGRVHFVTPIGRAHFTARQH